MASAKDVKILDREEDLIYQVDKNAFKQSRLNQIIQFITALPRFSFEMLMACIFSALVFAMLGAKREMVDIIQYLRTLICYFKAKRGLKLIICVFIPNMHDIRLH